MDQAETLSRTGPLLQPDYYGNATAERGGDNSALGWWGPAATEMHWPFFQNSEYGGWAGQDSGESEA